MTAESCVEQDTHESLDFDYLLSQIGEFGKYQKILFWFVCLPACIPCGFCAFNQLFMADVPEHWCKVPYLMKIFPQDWKKIGIPLKTNSNDTYSSCSRFKIDWQNVGVENLRELTANQSWPTEDCLDGWEYDIAEGKTSIVVDFDLVCDRDIYPTLGLASLNLGGPIGVYFFGVLNDKIGRKYSFFICLSTLICGGILTGLVTGFWFWAGCRFLVGLSVPAIYQIPFILSLELVGPKFRSFVTVFTCLFYTFGLILLSGITYLISDWRMLAFATSAPFIFYFFYWFYLPESPRWLIGKGRYDEACQILESIAQVNGKLLSENFKTKLKRLSLRRTKSEEKRLKKGPKISALFLTPNMRLKTILITFNWFANEMVYVGLSYYGPSLGSNEHLSFFLSATVEIPSYLCCLFVMDWWGRRWPMCLCMVISGVCCIATVLLPSDSYEWTLSLYLISKSMVSASFLIIYPFAGELYPTELRGIGIGISAYIGGLGLIIIPFITYLGKDNLLLPLLILGAVSIVGGIFCLRLPETLHQKLPQTIEEGEEFGKLWKVEDCWRCIPLNPKADSYENLSDAVEMKPRLMNQASRIIKEGSNIETNLDPTSGTMQMTYWF